MAVNLSDFNGTLGLAEPSSDNLAVATGNVSLGDLSGDNWARVLLKLHKDRPAIVRAMLPFPDGPIFLNGVATQPRNSGILHVADSVGGRV